MKKQQEFKISVFKKGDIITRIQPIEEIEQGMGMLGFALPSKVKSYIFVGTKLEFIGSLNGLIYCKQEGVMKELIYDKYFEGWAYWIDPKTL